jgi:hypothetical protein
MILTTGVDVGSSAVKVTVVESPKGSGREREGAKVLASVVERNRRRDAQQVLEMAYSRALAEAKISAIRSPTWRRPERARSSSSGQATSTG